MGPKMDSHISSYSALPARPPNSLSMGHYLSGFYIIFGVKELMNY